jgi:hypothetical protein
MVIDERKDPKEEKADEQTDKVEEEEGTATEGDSSIDPELGPFVCKHCREEFKTWAVLTRQIYYCFLTAHIVGPTLWF